MKTTPKIAEYLISRDKKMKSVIGENIIIDRPLESDYFASLVDTIISQQLSGKVAEVLTKRLAEACQGKFTPQTILKLEDEKIRSLGISYAKIKYLKSLATALESKVVDFSLITDLNDQEIIDMLTKIKGIGPWSAEMFLIFSLGKEDVFSCGDGGLVKAVNHYYGKGEDLSKETLLKISEKWRPYRSYASFYLWESLKRI